MNLCYEISSRLYRRTNRSAGLPAKGPADYWEWQFNSSEAYFQKFADLLQKLPGKRVVEIGCGLGGRTCYLATKDPEQIVGIDINHEEIDKAQDLAARLPEGDRKRVRFVKTTEGRPFETEPFDIVLLVDSMEHVRNPSEILDFAWTLTKPGGLCYFSTVGWYHYRGSHMNSTLPIPFLNLFFSEAAILDANLRILNADYYVPTMWDSNPPSARWQGVTRLNDRPGEYLNKITIRGIRRAMRASRFCGSRLDVRGFSYRRMPVFRCLNFLSRIPVIQEAYHSGVFARLERK